MTILLILAIVALAIDCAQTLDIRRHKALHEINPILGPHPVDWKIVVYFLVCIGALIAMAVYCPSKTWTQAILGTVLILEVWIIYRNKKLGLNT